MFLRRHDRRYRGDLGGGSRHGGRRPAGAIAPAWRDAPGGNAQVGVASLREPPDGERLVADSTRRGREVVRGTGWNVRDVCLVPLHGAPRKRQSHPRTISSAPGKRIAAACGPSPARSASKPCGGQAPRRAAARTLWAGLETVRCRDRRVARSRLRGRSPSVQAQARPSRSRAIAGQLRHPRGPRPVGRPQRRLLSAANQSAVRCARLRGRPAAPALARREPVRRGGGPSVSGKPTWA